MHSGAINWCCQLYRQHRSPANEKNSSDTNQWKCLNKGRPNWWHLLYYVSLLLNMFQMLIHPSSGACDYFVRYCVGCIVLTGGVLVLCSGSGCWWCGIRIPHHQQWILSCTVDGLQPSLWCDTLQWKEFQRSWWAPNEKFIITAAPET